MSCHLPIPPFRFSFPFALYSEWAPATAHALLRVLVCIDADDEWTNRTTEDVNYVPITSTAPASKYWGIDQSDSYDNNTILETTAGIVDTGSFYSSTATFAPISSPLWPFLQLFLCIHKRNIFYRKNTTTFSHTTPKLRPVY